MTEQIKSRLAIRMVFDVNVITCSASDDVKQYDALNSVSVYKPILDIAAKIVLL